MADENQASFIDNEPVQADPASDTQEQTPSIITDSTQDGAKQRPKWKAMLPDSLKDNESLDAFDGIEAMANAALASLDENNAGFELPAEDDAEGWETIYNKIGRPENKDDYTLSEDIDADTAEKMKDFAHSVGMNQQQLQKFAEQMKPVFAVDRAVSEAIYKGTREDTDKAMRKEWGDGYDKELNYTKKGAAELFDKETMLVLGMLNQLNNPAIVKVCNRYGKAIADDLPPSGSQKRSQVDPNNPWGYPEVKTQ